MKNPFEIPKIEESSIDNPFLTEEKRVNNPFLAQNNDIKFVNVVNNLKNSNETTLKIYWNSLEQIWNSLSDTNSTEVRNILLSLSDTKNYEEISKYLLELKAIADKYKKDTESTIDNASNEGKWILDSIKWFFLDSKTLNDIEGISIDWKVKSVKEFQDKLSNLISILNKDSKFSQLPDNQKNKIIEWLKKLWNWLEKEKNKTLDFLDNKINKIAQQIENQDDDWSISIKIEWIQIPPFSSKKEAFKYVQIIKEEAENEFQDLIADMWDILWNTLWQIFTSSIAFKPYIYTKNSISDWVENYQDNDHWALLVIDWIQILALTFASINYTETVYRRIVTDNIARSWIKKWLLFTKIKILDKDGKDTWKTRRVRINIRIPDYDLSDTNYYSSDSQDVELRNEYKQRITTIAKLEQQLETITDPKDKKAFVKELNKMKSYININTNTFWLKAYSLNKEEWKFRRFLNIFINWPTWLHLRDNATRNILLDKKSRKKLEEWADFIFKDASINFDDKTGQINSITENWESDNVKNIRKYINNISDTQRKKDILARFDKYIESLKNNPKAKDIIENDIYNIIENNYLEKKEIVKLIEKKYFKDLKSPEKREKGFINWIKEIWDDVVFRKNKFNRLLSEVWGNLAPASFTYKKSMAVKLKQIVDKNSWKWNEEDLKKLFDRIDSWKLEINQIYPWISKLKIIIDWFKWLVWKYWIEFPELHKLNNLWKKWWDLENIIKEWKEISKELGKAKEIFNKKGELKDNIKNIFELDTPNFPSTNSSLYWSDWKEQYFKNMFNDLEEFSQTDDFNLNSEKIKLEIIKLNNWYLTNRKILSLLDKLLTEEEFKKDNVKDFIKKVETWKMVIDLSNLNTYIPLLKAWSTISEKVVNFNISDEIYKINTKWKGLGEIHFKNPKFWIFEDWKINIESFKNNELEFAKILNFEAIINNKINIDWDFAAFMQDANKNWYTSIEFFNELNKSLKLSLTIDKTTVKRNYFNNLQNQVTTFYNWLNEVEKSKLINFIKDNSIDNSILPQDIKDALDIDSKSWEFKTQKAELKRIKIELFESTDKEEIKELKKEFNNYIKEQKIDRTSSEFKLIISDFESEFKRKYDSLELPTWKVNPNTTEEVKEQLDLLKEFKKLQAILEPLEIELTLRWKFKEAKEVETLLDGFRNAETLKKYITWNLDYSKEFFERKYLNAEKIRTKEVLTALLDSFKSIKFTKINISTFKAKIKATFNVDSDFKFSSVEDIKKFIKEIKL